jgi:hypothetical protein
MIAQALNHDRHNCDGTIRCMEPLLHVLSTWVIWSKAGVECIPIETCVFGFNSRRPIDDVETIHFRSMT